MKKISINFATFGCRLNQSETATLQALFRSDGRFHIATDDSAADVVIINTCTVTAHADRDALRLVQRLRRENPFVKIALVGCQAQTQKEIVRQWPNVQWVVGNREKMTLPEMIAATRMNAAALVRVAPLGRSSFTVPGTGYYPRHTRANIKIQEGCNAFCSFCEVPYARGRARSREFDDILREATDLTEHGHQEIVLTGVNIGMYGHKDRGLFDVVAAVQKIKKLKRVRISSLEPAAFDDRLLNMMFPDGKLCRFLHMPLQSADDTILKSMNRPYTFADYDKLTRSIKNHDPQICLGADILVGFPGETEERFQTTFTRLKSSAVDYFHVFSYSPRLLAKSRAFPQTTPASVVAERSRILRDLSLEKRKQFHSALIGTSQTVLFEEKKNGSWSGLSDHYIRVYAESPHDLRNQLVSVKFTKTGRNLIYGRIIKSKQ
jgi:threonylcarbamoyladenosine tRNA methylthiotransferase MtaB